MDNSQFALLKSKRFLPLFITQALGALNDNVFKNALAILLVYRLAAEAGLNTAVLATAAGGVFILPFFPVLRHGRSDSPTSLTRQD